MAHTLTCDFCNRFIKEIPETEQLPSMFIVCHVCFNKEVEK